MDLTATAAPECVDWYLKDGFAAIFWPEGSDPRLFHPMPELPKRYDVSFVGARYGVRGELVRRLRRNGIDVTTYGQGWPEGRIAIEALPETFARSKIVLGIGTIGYSTELVSLKLRDFDAPMSGSCYVTSANPDLASLYNLGEEIVVYTNQQECAALISALLRDDRRRETIAAWGRTRALTEHTWDQRITVLVSVLSEAADLVAG